MGFVGIVCGLKSEAQAVQQAFNDDRLSIRVSGANAERAEALTNELCDTGAEMIISVGVSGGLLPAYAPGDLVIGRQVITSTQERFACHEPSLAILKRSHKADGIQPSIIYGADDVILTTEKKNEIYQATGAKSVDMESHGAARAALKTDTPFLAIRAIADPADRALPTAALNAVNPDGSTRVFSTLINAAKDPGQLPALMQLGQDSQKALETLRTHLGGLLGVLLLSRNFS